MTSAPAALAAHLKSAAKCPPANRRLIAGDAQAIVYQTLPEGPQHGEIYGCSYSDRRSFRLGPAPYGSEVASGGVGPIALTGPVVAYGLGESFEGPMGHSYEEVLVRNLVTGKVIHRVPNGSPAKPGDVGLGETTAIVVKSNGSVAWIVRASEELGSIQVRSLDETGSHLLAASTEIGPDSLALAGNTLYWTQTGKPFSAQLQ